VYGGWIGTVASGGVMQYIWYLVWGLGSDMKFGV
jgi:hypothetical protein